MNKLDILIPMHNEDASVVKPLLDSIAIQQNVDFDSIGVIICIDGGATEIPEEFIKNYPFHIEVHHEPHRGVSGTRNACLDYSCTGVTPTFPYQVIPCFKRKNPEPQHRAPNKV